MIHPIITDPKNTPAFLVAELGINHDGKTDTLYKMIDAASEAKADAVKFQLYNIDGFYNKSIAPEAYQLFQSFHITYEQFLSLKDYAEKRNLIVFSAAFDFQTLDQLISDSIFPIKIASGDALTEPWIDLLLEKNIPFIISTGSLEEEEIFKLAQKINNSLSAMLYCVSEYPAPAEGFDIRFINTLQKKLPTQAIGFSDHSQGIALSLAAVSHGAKIIERHFTLFPERTDFDHPLSLDPEKFHEMVSSIRMIEKALGSGKRVATQTEQKIRSLAGRDIYAKKTIPANTIITEEFMILQRPGSGVKSSTFNSLLGKKHSQEISQGTRLLDIFGE